MNPFFNSSNRRRWRDRFAPRQYRSGTTVLEMVVAATLLTIGATVIAQGALLILRQQETVHRRVAALQEVANVMEQVGSLPWDELTSKRLTSIQPSPAFKDYDPTCSLNILNEDGPNDSREKMIRVSLRRISNTGREEILAELVTWRFAPEVPR